MRSLILLSTVGLLAAATPALAQYAGDPGATGARGPLTGSNPPMNPGWSHPDNGYGYGYGYRPGVEFYDVPVYEGRGAYEEPYRYNRW